MRFMKNKVELDKSLCLLNEVQLLEFVCDFPSVIDYPFDVLPSMDNIITGQKIIFWDLQY